jgi:zinc transport system substrate-binding protein
MGVFMKDFKKVFLILGIVVVLLAVYISTQTSSVQSKSIKPIVAVSSYALYDIVTHLAKNNVEIVNILPFGVDAHSFEPTPRLMASLEKSSLVVYSGAGLEPWIDGFVFKSDTIDMSKFVTLRKLNSKHSHNHSTNIHQNNLDPHYWLDFKNMKKATEIVTKALIKLDVKHSKIYELNKKNYIEMLEKLDNSYSKHLKNCKKNVIITNHNAFSYLASRYGFKVEALSGLSPEAQPSAKQIAKLMEHIKEDDIKTIFFESFVSDKVINAIAKDVKVDVDTLQPLGNITKDEAQAGMDYEKIMQENLVKLEKALECH